MTADTQARLLEEMSTLVFPQVGRLEAIVKQIDEPERQLLLKEIDWLYYEVDKMSRRLFITSKNEAPVATGWLLTITALKQVINWQASARLSGNTKST